MTALAWQQRVVREFEVALFAWRLTRLAAAFVLPSAAVIALILFAVAGVVPVTAAVLVGGPLVGVQLALLRMLTKFRLGLGRRLRRAVSAPFLADLDRMPAGEYAQLLASCFSRQGTPDSEHVAEHVADVCLGYLDECLAGHLESLRLCDGSGEMFFALLDTFEGPVTDLAEVCTAMSKH